MTDGRERRVADAVVGEGVVGLDWASYDHGAAYDEVISASGAPRPAARELAAQLAALGPTGLRARQDAAERLIRETGITFTVYSEGQNIDRAWPFDIVPRTLEMAE